MLCFISLILVNCASNKINQQAPGFLPDYTLLQLESGTNDDMIIYSYRSKTSRRSDYHCAIVESVVLYQKANINGITSVQIEKARNNINTNLKQIIGAKFNLTNKAESGVFRLQVAITGAKVEEEGLKLRNILPISAAIKIAKRATNLDKKKAVIIIEIKATDSVNNKLLIEIVSIMNGENFYLASNTNDEFQKLIVIWIKELLKRTNAYQK